MASVRRAYSKRPSSITSSKCLATLYRFLIRPTFSAIWVASKGVLVRRATSRAIRANFFSVSATRSWRLFRRYSASIGL